MRNTVLRLCQLFCFCLSDFAVNKCCLLIPTFFLTCYTNLKRYAFFGYFNFSFLCVPFCFWLLYFLPKFQLDFFLFFHLCYIKPKFFYSSISVFCSLEVLSFTSLNKSFFCNFSRFSHVFVIAFISSKHYFWSTNSFRRFILDKLCQVIIVLYIESYKINSTYKQLVSS